jgi:hypothetical protein
VSIETRSTQASWSPLGPSTPSVRERLSAPVRTAHSQLVILKASVSSIQTLVRVAIQLFHAGDIGRSGWG